MEQTEKPGLPTAPQLFLPTAMPMLRATRKPSCPQPFPGFLAELGSRFLKDEVTATTKQVDEEPKAGATSSPDPSSTPHASRYILEEDPFTDTKARHPQINHQGTKKPLGITMYRCYIHLWAGGLQVA